MSQTKKCSKCKEEKETTLEYFGPHTSNKDGLHAWCRNCFREYQKSKPKKEKYRESLYRYYNRVKGVYGIFGINDECLYIGESKSINRRFNDHRCHSRNPAAAIRNNHCQVELYKFLHNYGFDNLDFRLLEECDDHKEKEKDYINKYNPVYNNA
jgi:hypothetical protein